MVRHVLGFHASGGPNFALIIFGIFWVTFDFASVVTGCVFVALMNDVVPRAISSAVSSASSGSMSLAAWNHFLTIG